MDFSRYKNVLMRVYSNCEQNEICDKLVVLISSSTLLTKKRSNYHFPVSLNIEYTRTNTKYYLCLSNL